MLALPRLVTPRELRRSQTTLGHYFSVADTSYSQSALQQGSVREKTLSLLLVQSSLKKSVCHSNAPRFLWKMYHLRDFSADTSAGRLL